MKNTIMIATLLLLTAAANPPPAQRHFSVPAFDSVELAGVDRVEIVPGAALDVVASGDPRAVASLDIGARDGRLRIARKPGSFHDHGATITVTMPHIRTARLAGSGDMTVSRFDQDAFEGVVAGSGDFKATAMRVRLGAFKLAGSGGLDLDAVTATDLTLEVDGSGDLDASGATTTATIALAGSGDIDATRLHADTATVSLAGSGDIHAFAARRATVSANGSGGVTITGHPTCSISGSRARSVTCG